MMSGAAHSWVGEQLLAREDWRIDVGSTLDRDIGALLAWAEGREDPAAALEASSVDLPGFDALAARALEVLSDAGPGAAWGSPRRGGGRARQGPARSPRT